MEYKSYYDSPVGRLELLSDGVSLTAVLFENQQGDGTREENTSLAIFREATQWLDAYFKGDNPEITIFLKLYEYCVLFLISNYRFNKILRIHCIFNILI
ncbi:methylated-DNA--protein-cysteine methyltransferase [Staphylococcus aureus]|nr:methylated-DNA--protein-cysteine methyltransferase [Staphylococcus aureus]